MTKVDGLFHLKLLLPGRPEYVLTNCPGPWLDTIKCMFQATMYPKAFFEYNEPQFRTVLCDSARLDGMTVHFYLLGQPVAMLVADIVDPEADPQHDA